MNHCGRDPVACRRLCAACSRDDVAAGVRAFVVVNLRLQIRFSADARSPDWNVPLVRPRILTKPTVGRCDRRRIDGIDFARSAQTNHGGARDGGGQKNDG